MVATIKWTLWLQRLSLFFSSPDARWLFPFLCGLFEFRIRLRHHPWDRASTTSIGGISHFPLPGIVHVRNLCPKHIIGDRTGTELKILSRAEKARCDCSRLGAASSPPKVYSCCSSRKSFEWSTCSNCCSTNDALGSCESRRAWPRFQRRNSAAACT